jgi:hypothetical protein
MRSQRSRKSGTSEAPPTIEAAAPREQQAWQSPKLENEPIIVLSTRAIPFGGLAVAASAKPPMVLPSFAKLP